MQHCCPDGWETGKGSASTGCEAFSQEATVNPLTQLLTK
jgi:hypothetical protein